MSSPTTSCPASSCPQSTVTGRKSSRSTTQAATPHQRALAHPATRKRPVITMNARYKKLHLGALQRQILDPTARLEALAQAKSCAYHSPQAEVG